MYCIAESTCDIFGTSQRHPAVIRRPPQWSVVSIVIRRPRNCAPLAPPSLRPCTLANNWPVTDKNACIECAYFFGHRRNYFLNDRKILSQYGHNVRKGRLVQSSKWASFRSPNPARVRNHKPEPGPSPEFIYEARFRPETKFAELVRICATAGYQKRSLRVYLCKHTVLSYPR